MRKIAVIAIFACFNRLFSVVLQELPGTTLFASVVGLEKSIIIRLVLHVLQVSEVRFLTKIKQDGYRWLSQTQCHLTYLF